MHRLSLVKRARFQLSLVNVKERKEEGRKEEREIRRKEGGKGREN